VSAQLLSRILLSTLCLAAVGAGVYFLTVGDLLFGLVLLALGAAALLWLWKPWQYLRRHP
jgi:membrane protein implicated in regulation of membrane protease activity